MTLPATDDMHRRWDRFAREDPMFYIATARRAWTPEAFLESGRSTAEGVMKWIGDDVPRRRMLDLGCGLGRTAVHFADSFDLVEAIDISPTMIEKARALCPRTNIRFSVGSGSDLGQLGDDHFDAVFCRLMFQHIPDRQVIASYLWEIARVLQPQGKAVVQFDTRPNRLLIRLYRTLPDIMLPRVHRRCIRRYRRQPGEVRQLLDQAGLRILDEHGARSAGHVFLLAPARSIPADQSGG